MDGWRRWPPGCSLPPVPRATCGRGLGGEEPAAAPGRGQPPALSAARTRTATARGGARGRGAAGAERASGPPAAAAAAARSGGESGPGFSARPCKSNPGAELRVRFLVVASLTRVICRY